MDRIIHLVDIAAPRDRVYEALSTQDGLAAWWTTRVKSDDRPGGMIYFTFHEGFSPDMEVLELRRRELVEWSCVGGYDPWFESRLIFMLRDVLPGTRLQFEQIFKQAPADEDYGAYNFKWGFYLNSLKDYCETGRGRPYAA